MKTVVQYAWTPNYIWNKGPLSLLSIIGQRQTIWSHWIRIFVLALAFTLTIFQYFKILRNNKQNKIIKKTMFIFIFIKKILNFWWTLNEDDGGGDYHRHSTISLCYWSFFWCWILICSLAIGSKQKNKETKWRFFAHTFDHSTDFPMYKWSIC